MIKLNPLTLIILNILFPVVNFLGKGIKYEINCMLISIEVLLVYNRYFQYYLKGRKILNKYQRK